MDLFQDLFQDLFNSQTLANMAIVSTLVSLIREILKAKFNLRGGFAVVVTFLVSIIYGVLQFGLSSEYGVTYGAILGVVTALSFYVVKNTGAVLSNYNPNLPDTSRQSTEALFRGDAPYGQRRKPTWTQIFKFILFRKL